MLKACLLALALGLMSIGGTASAERSDRFGDYELHYNAIPTGMLQPEIAEAYRIHRSRNRGLLMVTLLHRGEPVAADVSATATNLEQQQQEVPLRQVREGEAVYYLGTFRVSDGERLTFQVQASPNGSESGPFHISFLQRFHAPEY